MARDVKNIVEIIKFGAAASGSYDAAKADGKFDAQDLVHLLAVVPLVEPAVKDAKDVIAEFEDLDAEELALIVSELQKVSIIGNEAELLNKIRVCLVAARANYDVYLAFAKKAA